jgi:hypothetical protein
VDKWEAAGFSGMTIEMIDRVYGHHHPDQLKSAAHAWALADAFHWQNHWQRVLRTANRTSARKYWWRTQS